MLINNKTKTNDNNSSNTSNIRGNNTNTESFNPLEDNTIITSEQTKLELLRVARHELSSGNTTGSVYMRLSSGAVAFPIDRSACQARVDRIIVQTIESLEKKEDL